MKLFKRLVMGLAGLALLLIAADTALWVWATGRLLAGWQDWAAAARQDGWQIASRPPRRGGWPLAATLTLPAPRIAGGADYLPGGIDWQADALTLRLAPAHWHVLRIIPHGRQTLALAGRPAASLVAARMRIDVKLRPQPGQAGATLQAGGVELRLADGTKLAIGGMVADLWAGRTPRMVLASHDITLPPGPGRALAPSIASLALQVRPDGALPAALTPAALGRWRQEGGSLVFSGIALRWGPLSADGAARLGLDGGLQPVAASRLTLLGWQPALDRLAAHGAIRPQAALAAGAVLGLLAHSTTDGSDGAVDLPLTIQDRQLRLGRIPLARLPLLVWPAG